MNFLRQARRCGLRGETTPEYRWFGIPPARAAELPEHLEPEERESYVGLVHHAISWEGDELVVGVECTRPLPARARLSVYALGYVAATGGLVRCPKCRWCWSRRDIGCWTRAGRREGRGVVMANQRGQKFAVRIPLRVIGDPEKVFIGTQTHGEDVHLDMLPWRIVDLQRRGREMNLGATKAPRFCYGAGSSFVCDTGERKGLVRGEGWGV